MKRSKILVVAMLMLALLAGGNMGCSSGGSSGGGGGGSGTVATVDLAVTDSSINNNIFFILLWFDVLANAGPALPDPNVILDPGDRTPVNATFYNGDLYVATTQSSSAEGGVLIYRDYLTLTDADAPDAVLFDVVNPLLGPETIQRIALENDVLVGTTWYTTVGMYIWDNAGSLTDGAPPDVFLNDAGMGLAVFFADCLQDVKLVGGILVAASCNTGTDGAVGIWSDVQNILDAGTAEAPDVLLTDFDNFLDLGYGMRSLDVDSEGALYVGEFYGYTIYKFNDLSAITTASLPDAVITGCGDGSTSTVCDIDTPNNMLVVNDTLFVANKNYYDTGVNAGVVGFLSASNLSNNQIPSIHLTRDVGIGGAERLATAGGALFISGVELDDVEFLYKSVHIYRDASNVFTSVASDLSILGDQSTDFSILEYPSGVGVIVRGTVDNFFDTGT